MPAIMQPHDEKPDEQAVLFMRRHFADGDKIAAYGPCHVWTANPALHYQKLHGLRERDSYESVRAWVEERSVVAIYVDKALRNEMPEVWEMINEELRDVYVVAFRSGNGEVEVLIDRSKSVTP